MTAVVLYPPSGSGSWVLQSFPQTGEATQEKLESSITGRHIYRIYMHVPLRVAWKGPRVVVNTMISAQSRSLKALTFIIYMRVVAFACSHSHTAASCISEAPVCEDKTHTHHLASMPLSRLHNAPNPLNLEIITGTILTRTDIVVLALYRFSFMQQCFGFWLCVWSWLIFVCFFNLKNTREQQSVFLLSAIMLNKFRAHVPKCCVF